MFDAEEWGSSRQALVKRELYTGLTFVQRAKLRQQLVKGDIVDVPNMMQRYGPAPSWYTGVDPDDPGPQTSVPTSNFQVGGSSSSSDPLGPGVQIGGSSSDPSDHGLQIGGSSSGPSDSFSAIVSRIVVTDLCVVLERHLGVLLALIGRSSPSWLRLRRVSSTFWHNRALCFVAELQDTGSVPTLIGAGFSATFQFVQNGDQFSWVPVSLVVQGQVEAEVVSGEGAGTVAQPTVTESTYEDLCEIADASDAYFQAAAVPFGGEEDSELGIEGDGQDPYVQWPLPGLHAEWPPRDPGQWENAFNQLFDGSEESDSGDSTTEPSVADVSSSSSSECRVGTEGQTPEDRVEVGGLPAHYEAREEALVVRYVDDERVVPLAGWSIQEVEAIVQGLTEGDWEAYYEVVGGSSDVVGDEPELSTGQPSASASSCDFVPGNLAWSFAGLGLAVALQLVGFRLFLWVLALGWLTGLAKRIQDVDRRSFRGSHGGSSSVSGLTGSLRLLFLILWIFIGAISPASAVGIVDVRYERVVSGLGDSLEGERRRSSAVEKELSGEGFADYCELCVGDHHPVFW